MAIEAKASIQDLVLMEEYEQTVSGKQLDPDDMAEKMGLSLTELTKIEIDLEKLGFVKLKLEGNLLSDSKATENGIVIAQGLFLLDRLMNDIGKYLRKGIYNIPKDEIEIQNSLEFLLSIQEYEFERTLNTVPTATKYTIPDFIFDRNGIALEVKYCDDKRKEKDIIDEMNADITSYLSKFRRVLFLVYDISTIRDVEKFEKWFTKANDKVYVQVIKH